MTATLANAHADALIREIEDEGAKERRAIAEAAEREAAAIVRRTLADVRRRVHDEIDALARAKASAGWRAPRRSSKPSGACAIRRAPPKSCIPVVPISSITWSSAGREKERAPVLDRLDGARTPASGCRPAPGPSSIRAIGARRTRPNCGPRFRRRRTLTFKATDDFDAGFRIQADGRRSTARRERLLAEQSATRRACSPRCAPNSNVGARGP